MNASDLMIGDWIEHPKGFARVTQVKDNNVVCIDYTVENDGIQDASKFKPIRLTPQILLNNGWKKYKDEELYVRPQYYLDIEFFNGCPKILRNLVNCYYVHELQHVLKLCGIEQEIII